MMRLLVAVAVLALVGCAGAPPVWPPDAGADAGNTDAGRPDAGAPDAGEPDAGEPDAGPPDAGPPRDGGPSVFALTAGGGSVKATGSAHSVTLSVGRQPGILRGTPAR